MISLFAVVRTAPRWLWQIIGSVLGTCLLWWGHGQLITRAHQRMTRVTAPVLQERVNVAAAHTDTSSARVEKTAQRARRTLQAVPPRIIDSLPAVRELVDVTEQLIVDATALRADVITERAVREELHVVTSVQIQALQQENAGLRKRPSRKKAAAVTVLGVVVGYIVGSRH